MGRHRFEDQFKTALDKREISPTEGSWEKLASRLETKEKKTLPFYWWMGIAATVVGAIFIAGMVYYNDPVTNSSVIVETSSEAEKDMENTPVQNIKTAPSERLATENIKPEEVPSADSAKPEKNKIIEKEKISPDQLAERNTKHTSEAKEIEIESQLAITGNENANKDAEENNFPEPHIAEETAFAAEIQNVLHRIAEREGETGTVTDAEVDALLAEAASQIIRRRNIEKADGKIDATALLWDVEMEMEHSFREKVFEVLKEGYLKAKSAVANRNY